MILVLLSRRFYANRPITYSISAVHSVVTPCDEMDSIWLVGWELERRLYFKWSLFGYDPDLKPTAPPHRWRSFQTEYGLLVLLGTAAFFITLVRWFEMKCISFMSIATSVSLDGVGIPAGFSSFILENRFSTAARKTRSRLRWIRIELTTDGRWSLRTPRRSFHRPSTIWRRVSIGIDASRNKNVSTPDRCFNKLLTPLNK